MVKFAVGVSMSQGRQPSALLVELQKRYIADEIDLAELAAVIDAEYAPAPGPDPYAKYAPAEGPEVESEHVYDPYFQLILDDAPVSLA